MSPIFARRLSKAPPSLDRFASFRRLLATICTPSTTQQIESTATHHMAHSIRAQHLHSLSPPKPMSLTRQVGLHLDVIVHVRRNVLASKDASRWDPVKAGFHSGVSVVRDLEQVGSSIVGLEARPSSAVVSTLEGFRPLLPTEARHVGSSVASGPILGLGTSSSRSKRALTPFAARAPSGFLHSRLYSTKALSTKALYVAKTVDFVTNLSQTYGLDRPVPLQEIMSQMRDIQLLQSYQETKAVSARGFKDAVRALYPLWHRVDQSGGKEVVRMKDLVGVLSPCFTVPWAEIAHILNKGKASKLSCMNKEQKTCVLFMRIYNIGRARAKQFYAAGARTLEDLLKLHELGTIKLQESQIIGIKLLDDFERLISRSEMDELKARIEDCLKSIVTGDEKLFEAELLGSYRRGLDFASDLDLAVRHPSFTDSEDKEKARRLLDRIVEALEASGLLANQYRLAHGDKKYMGLIKLKDEQHYRRIDIRLGPYDSYPYMLLGGSGDALLMKLMRHRAKARGMCLNEYGMGDKFEKEDQNPNGFRPGTMRIVTNEREIFDLLGVPYLEPHEREYSHWRQKYIDAGIDLAAIN
ncbi:BZ3500_MvSof-1268-A1-R1_Chr5-2g08073 [Microbotryum saponariae]|uniref:DNA polymerase n=1 Tax=Microbotryum saponariae TaxID=289078 RepID=A0A2X0NED9_9BASI|nr:BZ3500_MvSof-1268-A1-R1_Chr5-2g08073 [Microbotryum saponariae]SDA05942.1 BZ3501_MvSof-1269-A2-R1_Chr5-2g07895 [Microbotryum saponariae]